MILTDDTHALMEQGDFDGLPEYSCSLPTGVVIGKRWKRGEPYQQPRTHWYMGEFIPDPAGNPEMAAIKFREIIIV